MMGFVAQQATAGVCLRDKVGISDEKADVCSDNLIAEALQATTKNHEKEAKKKW